MKTKQSTHTPGPWKINGGCIDNDYNYGDAKFERIAVVRSVNDQSPTDTANARLIAAAPEMLMLLKRALTDIEFYCDERDENHRTDTTAEEIRSVIAKAEGRG